MLADQVETEVRRQLIEIERVLPASALASLRRVSIWVDHKASTRTAAYYHPLNSSWIRDGRLSPQLAGAVQIVDAKRFLDYIRTQPSLLLHELAHAYHEQVLARGNPAILAAYENAQATGLYQAVRRYDGRVVRAYALTSPQEYFAELSEAYFGQNDFYPFTRAELLVYDPAGSLMLQQVWGAAP